MILSNVLDEADLFVPSSINTDDEFNGFLNAVFPPYALSASVDAAIEARYPPVMAGGGGNYTNERDRLKASSATPLSTATCAI